MHACYVLILVFQYLLYVYIIICIYIPCTSKAVLGRYLDKVLQKYATAIKSFSDGNRLPQGAFCSKRSFSMCNAAPTLWCLHASNHDKAETNSLYHMNGGSTTVLRGTHKKVQVPLGFSCHACREHAWDHLEPETKTIAHDLVLPLIMTLNPMFSC